MPSEIPPYVLTNIKYAPHPSIPGKIRARAQYRRQTGSRRLYDVYGTGASKAAALRALQSNFDRHRLKHRGGTQDVSPSSTVAEVAEVWLREKASELPALADRTLVEYRKWVRAYIDDTSYGRTKISAAANQARGEEHLRLVANGLHKPIPAGTEDKHRGGNGAMTSARKVMHGVMDTAARHGAIPHPVKFKRQTRTVESLRDRTIDTDRAFTSEELRHLQEAADAGHRDLGDLVAFLSVVGCRISEALRHVHWSGVDFDARTVLIAGTKTANANRTVRVPQWVADRLRARAEAYGTSGVVFGYRPTDTGRGRHAGIDRTGKPRDLSNVETAMRELLDSLGMHWAGTHTFRRTVATMLDERGQSIGAIASALGQHPATTTTYIKRQAIAEAAADVFADPW